MILLTTINKTIPLFLHTVVFNVSCRPTDGSDNWIYLLQIMPAYQQAIWHEWPLIMLLNSNSACLSFYFAPLISRKTFLFLENSLNLCMNVYLYPLHWWCWCSMPLNVVNCQTRHLCHLLKDHWSSGYFKRRPFSYPSSKISFSFFVFTLFSLALLLFNLSHVWS